MPRQREHERNIWESLLLYITAATTEELMVPLGDIDTTTWTDAEWEKYTQAYEQVHTEIERRARHRRVTRPPAPHTRRTVAR